MTNVDLCCITYFSFYDDDLMCTETCRNIHCDIVI